jgi:predicted SnoaL-like aldol condensation-catalyzing enzyme
MSVEANKAVVTRAIELFRPDTLEQYLETYAPDSKLHFLPPELPPGREGARLFYSSFMKAFPDINLRADDLMGEGDKVACRFTVTGTHRGELNGIPPTNRRVTMTGITIIRVENGKFVERWSEADFLGLMRQLGAVPA